MLTTETKDFIQNADNDHIVDLYNRYAYDAVLNEQRTRGWDDALARECRLGKELCLKELNERDAQYKLTNISLREKLYLIDDQKEKGNE